MKHINNIYKSGELPKDSTCSILEQVAADGKNRKMNFYNLDVIISVGYRVNSTKATQFRQRATQRLKDYLVKGMQLMRSVWSKSNRKYYISKPEYRFLAVPLKPKYLCAKQML